MRRLPRGKLNRVNQGWREVCWAGWALQGSFVALLVSDPLGGRYILEPFSLLSYLGGSVNTSNPPSRLLVTCWYCGQHLLHQPGPGCKTFSCGPWERFSLDTEKQIDALHVHWHKLLPNCMNHNYHHHWLCTLKQADSMLLCSQFSHRTNQCQRLARALHQPFGYIIGKHLFKFCSILSKLSSPGKCWEVWQLSAWMRNGFPCWFPQLSPHLTWCPRGLQTGTGSLQRGRMDPAPKDELCSPQGSCQVAYLPRQGYCLWFRRKVSYCFYLFYLTSSVTCALGKSSLKPRGTL